ncbi:hypothetical protein MRX96_030055 [Rhipicephalus microplus]
MAACASAHKTWSRAGGSPESGDQAQVYPPQATASVPGAGICPPSPGKLRRDRERSLITPCDHLSFPDDTRHLCFPILCRSGRKLFQRETIRYGRGGRRVTPGDSLPALNSTRREGSPLSVDI